MSRSAASSIFSGCDLRVRLQHDRVALLAGERRDRLPQLLGDERDERMREAQRRLEHAHQRAARARAAAASSPLARELHLRELDVPVAVLVPDELVDRARRRGRSGSRRSPASTSCFGALQRGRRSSGRRTCSSTRQRLVEPARPCPRRSSARSASRSTACCRSCGSPRSGSRSKLSVRPKRRERGEREAQRVGAERRDAVRELLARALRRSLRPARGSIRPTVRLATQRLERRCRRSGRAGRACCPSTSTSSGPRRRARCALM